MPGGAGVGAGAGEAVLLGFGAFVAGVCTAGWDWSVWLFFDAGAWSASSASSSSLDESVLIGWLLAASWSRCHSYSPPSVFPATTPVTKIPAPSSNAAAAIPTHVQGRERTLRLPSAAGGLGGSASVGADVRGISLVACSAVGSGVSWGSGVLVSISVLAPHSLSVSVAGWSLSGGGRGRSGADCAGLRCGLHGGRPGAWLDDR